MLMKYFFDICESMYSIILYLEIVRFYNFIIAELEKKKKHNAVELFFA